MAVIFKKSIFIHVPKTAGISIGRAVSQNSNYKGDHNRVSQKYSSTEWNKFIVCRNPYDRLISAFEYQKKMASLNINLGFQQRKFLKENPKATFSNFVNFIYRNRRLNELHTRPQIYWTKYLNNSPIQNLKIIRFENLQQELNEYFEEIKVPKIILTNENTSIRSSFFEYYSNPTVILQVQKLYSMDFNFFRYSIDINNLNNDKG